MMTKRRKAEDFIGKRFNNNKLTVVGISSVKDKHRRKMLEVKCVVCEKDPELFTDGIFLSSLNNLIKGHIPCGCSKSPKLNERQWNIILQRIAKDRDFRVLSYDGEYNGILTRVNCECNKDHYSWTTNIHRLIHLKAGCKECGVRSQRLDETVVLENCTKICLYEGYEFLGFVSSYKNKESKIKYSCPLHGIHEVSYNNFTRGSNRCPKCSEHGYNPNKAGTFYIVRWYKDDHDFIKFGITNRQTLDRISDQLKGTLYKYNILFQKTWEDGCIPLKIESTIKSSGLFSCGVICRDNFKDGFTETVDVGCITKLIDFVLDIDA